MATLHQSSRADLLRVLVAAGVADTQSEDSEQSRLARLLKLELRDELRQPAGETGSDETPLKEIAPQFVPGDTSVEAHAFPRRRPLQTHLFALLGCEETTATPPSRRSDPSLTPLTASDCAPRIRAPQTMPPLVGRTRLWPALRRSLGFPRFGQLDVPGLVRRLARAESLRRLPRACRRDGGNEVWVIADVAQRLIPVESDYLQTLREVERLYGKANVRLWAVSESPEHTLWVRQGRGKRKGVRGRIPTPPPGTPVLILGDLGLLSPGRVAEPPWLEFCKRMDNGGARPVAWVPLSQRLVTRASARRAQVHCLGVGDLRPVNPASCAGAPPLPAEALEALLARIACCVRLEPALLRSLRLMRADTAAEPGLEGLVWGHEAVAEAANFRFCAIAVPRQAEYRARFAKLDAEQQDDVLRRMLVAHAHRGRSTESIEILIWQVHAGRPAPAGVADARIEEAGPWLARLGEHAQGHSEALMSYAVDLVDGQSGDTVLMKEHSQRFAQLWAFSGKALIPAGLKPADVAAAKQRIGRDEDERDYVLIQQRDRLFLEPREPRQKRELDGWAPLPWMAVTITGGFEWSRSDGAIRQWCVPALKPLELPLGDAPERCTFTLTSGGRKWVMGLLKRPSWAIEWGQDATGLYALAPSPLGEPRRLYWDNPTSMRFDLHLVAGRGFSAETVPIAPGIKMWADLKYGLVLDVTLGSATQRFRWIEPGEFVMGSPDGEVGRNDNEGPQHVVRLTEGFWLAETACSQGVWESVMGSNPSRFKDDPQNPVEQVSWDDVQGFLREVEKRVAGVKADLPTEAEWEYACRGGSETAFSWGDGIDPSRANYDGTYSYADGPTGEYREKTVPVKSFEPNAWGLYQMHGNVDEWCSDGRREYDGALQVDPRGPIGDEPDAPRAVRGGSWLVHPRGLRAAFRHDWHRDGRFDYRGFRFSLRSTSGPEGSAERSPEATVAPEGPQGKSPAPGRGRGEGVSEGSSARRNAGPTTMLDRLKAKLGFASKPDQSEEE
jgi:formylglycine-generating enzyme required for sulfatase activity